MPDQTLTPTTLQVAIGEAVEFARRHGVDSIDPLAFGIQPSDAGITTATYVDGDHAVTVTVDRHGHTSIGVAELDWIHHEADETRDPCECCGECEGCYETVCECPPPAPPMTTVFLPGDAPRAAFRDSDGDIRRYRDGLFIAGRDTTREQIETRLACYDGVDTSYADTMRELYSAAIELIDHETKEHSHA